MIFSYDWLKEFLPAMPKPQELLDELTLHSVEVEEIDKHVVELGNVVVAEMLSVHDHPDADKLHVGSFDVGEEKPRQIVFGLIAELKTGDKIPVALSPTVLPGNFKIKERTLRGELSQGMCCLNSELGILDNKEDVHRFESDVPNGTPIIDVLPLGETVVDIDNKSMTHRADLFSHMNMAREVAAVFGKKFSTPSYPALPTGLPEPNIHIEDKEACRRYIGIEMEVTVGPSPDFIASRLRTCGVQVINNVVDITNYVMLELGNPLHAFDAAAITDSAVIVRRAKKGETLKALDNETKKLDESVLVIADAKGPLAIAGVIGGTKSGVTNETATILLEAANFEPLIIRKAAQVVGARTEGAMRWEKGISPELAEVAARRAVELLTEHAHGTVTKIVDRYPTKQESWSVAVPDIEITRLAGYQFTTKQVQDYLSRIECQVKRRGRGDKIVYTVTPPWFRQDLRNGADIIEEVVRLHGVNNIPEQQLVFPLHVGEQQGDLPWIRRVKHALAGMGLLEIQNFSFYGEELMTAAGLSADKDHIELQNPLSEDLRFMRVSLLPYMLETVAKNQRHRAEFGLFEVGHVYFADREVQQLGITMTGGEDSYRKLRAVVETLLAELHIDYTTSIISKSVPCEFWGMYQGNRALRFDVDGEILGTIGLVSDVIRGNLNIDPETAFATISIAAITSHAQQNAQMTPLSTFPSITLDLSILVDEEITWSHILQVIQKRGGPLLRDVRVVEIYRGNKIPEGQKSITCSIDLLSYEETLEMATAEELRDRIMTALGTAVGAQLRAK